VKTSHAANIAKLRDLLRKPASDSASEADGAKEARCRLRQTEDGIAFNQHYSCEGAFLYKHACVLGCEGIVSKWLGSPYHSGRVDHWVKIKNPAAPVVRREAEEDWDGRRRRR
jgi:hypothetical protein